jgi:hypothetical protein
MVDKPLSRQTEKTTQSPRSPEAPRVHEAPLVLVVPCPVQPVLPRATTLWALPQVQSQLISPKHLPRAPGPMDSELPKGINLASAHPCLSLRNSCDIIHMLWSLCGTSQSLSMPDFTSGGSGGRRYRSRP